MFGKGLENRAKKENSLSLRSWMGEKGRMKCEVKGDGYRGQRSEQSSSLHFMTKVPTLGDQCVYTS